LIIYDKFHVMKHLGAAMDDVRKGCNRAHAKDFGGKLAVSLPNGPSVPTTFVEYLENEAPFR
jgi:hypothetical protein